MQSTDRFLQPAIRARPTPYTLYGVLINQCHHHQPVVPNQERRRRVTSSRHVTSRHSTAQHSIARRCQPFLARQSPIRWLQGSNIGTRRIFGFSFSTPLEPHAHAPRPRPTPRAKSQLTMGVDYRVPTTKYCKVLQSTLRRCTGKSSMSPLLFSFVCPFARPTFPYGAEYSGGVLRTYNKCLTCALSRSVVTFLARDNCFSQTSGVFLESLNSHRRLVTLGSFWGPSIPTSYSALSAQQSFRVPGGAQTRSLHSLADLSVRTCGRILLYSVYSTEFFALNTGH